MLWKEDQSPRVKEERKPTLRGKCESVFSGRHMDNVRKETHVVSVMNLPLGAQRRKGRSSSPARHSNAKTDGEGEKPQKNQTTEMKALQTKGAKLRADSNSVKNRRVSSASSRVSELQV